MHRRFLPPVPAFAVLAFSFLVSATVQAVLVVDYGGNYPTGGFSNGSLETKNFGGFTGGNPIQLVDLPSGPDLYGQVNWTSGPDTGTGAGGQILNSGSLDRIELKRGLTNLAAVILFRQSDFLNGMNSGNISLGAGSTVSMNINTFALFDAGRVVIRLQGGSLDGYYISQETPFGSSGLKQANLTELTWLAYDPATDIRSFGAPVSLLEEGQINHVTEIGFYAQQSAAALSSDATAFRLDSFEVDAVPEPSPLLPTALGLGLLLVTRRRPKARRGRA